MTVPSTTGRPAPAADGARKRSWIAKLLELERDGDVFVAPEPAAENASGRLFGGLIAAQSLAAACATLEDGKLPQSLHLYFVRGGRPDVDVEMVVERTRDGRSFDTRRVTALQDGTVILEMLASFHTPEPGTDWHPPAPAMADLSDTTPLAMPPQMSTHFELRAPGPAATMFSGPPHWIRSRHPIEDDPIIRACTLTYMSDMGLMAASRPRNTPLVLTAGTAASLDHAIWFHRPFIPDAWHLYDAQPLNNNDSRGLAIGAFYDAAGTLVATMTQEALWRS